MMMKNVIFLIDSEFFDKNLLGITLEKHTKCKVFNFFSYEETLLYKKLRPNIIVHDNGTIDPTFYENEVEFYNISDYKSDNKRDTSEVVFDLANQVKELVS